MYASYRDLETKIIQWSEARRIIPKSTVVHQFMKGTSEWGELADAILKNDKDKIEDSVGDVMVCLINACALADIDLVQCMARAYEEIKDRRGTLLPNGVFVKEGA